MGIFLAISLGNIVLITHLEGEKKNQYQFLKGEGFCTAEGAEQVI